MKTKKPKRPTTAAILMQRIRAQDEDIRRQSELISGLQRQIDTQRKHVRDAEAKVPRPVMPPLMAADVTLLVERLQAHYGGGPMAPKWRGLTAREAGVILQLMAEAERLRVKDIQSEQRIMDLQEQLAAAERRAVAGDDEAAEEPAAQTFLDWFSIKDTALGDEMKILAPVIPYLRGMRDSAGLSEDGAEWIRDAIDGLDLLRRLVGALEREQPLAPTPFTRDALPRGLERQAE